MVGGERGGKWWGGVGVHEEGSGGHVDKILALLFPKDPVIPYWAPGVSMSPYALWAP